MKTLANSEWQDSHKIPPEKQEPAKHGVNGKVSKGELASGQVKSNSGKSSVPLTALEQHTTAEPSFSFWQRLGAIPLVYKILPMVLLLLYALVINIELSTGSQRYVVEVSNQTVESFSCIGKDEAIAMEMRYQKRFAAQNELNETTKVAVSRKKMHIFSKWIYCGVL